MDSYTIKIEHEDQAMKWNYIKDGVLPRDCELVIGISYWRDEEDVYSLEYRDRENYLL